MKIKLVSALEEELSDDLKKEYPYFITGIGPVNAGVGFTHYLSNLDQTQRDNLLVINIGTAASFRRKFKYVGICSSFNEASIYRNANVDKSKEILSSYEGMCKSVSIPFVLDDADIFDYFGWLSLFDYDFIDMEAYALAKACKLFDVKFVSIKIVSDSGIKNLSDFYKSLEELRAILGTNVQDYINRL